jgi:NACHT conflict system protein
VSGSAEPHEADQEQIEAAIETAEFPRGDQNIGWQVQKAYERYPDAVAGGLLRRLEAGRDLPFRASDFLTAVSPVDDGPIAEAATNLSVPYERAHVAAGVVGPKTVEALLDALIPLAERIAAGPGTRDPAISESYGALKDRIEVTRRNSFAAALLSRGETDEAHRIGLLADLLARHGTRETRREVFTVEDSVRQALIGLVHRWAETLLSSPASTRYQLAEVARAIGRLAAPELLADLTRMLAEDLSRWRTARARRGSNAQMTIEERSDAAHCWTRQYREAFAAIGGEAVVEILRPYLEDEDFGFDAGWVLQEIWQRQQNEPPPDPLKAWPDFADVRARREQRRAATELDPASPIAEMIFAAINRLAVSGEKLQRLAIALGRIGLAMPHGDQRRVIETLVGLPLPVRSKRELLAALILDGEVVSADLVLRGVREWLDEAQSKSWMYREGLWEVEGLLQLLPFTDQPAAMIEGVEIVAGALPELRPMERAVATLGDAPDGEAERVLRELMRRHPRLADNHSWVRAIVKRGTRGAGMMLMDLAADRAFVSAGGGADSFWIGRELLALVQWHPGLRAELLRRYECASDGEGRLVFEYAIAEFGDPEAVLALVRAHAARRQAFDGLLHHALRETALSKEPAAGWAGAYELRPVPLPGLRKELFAMLESTPAAAPLAEQCLTAIDELRDEYGSSEFEPRHPDVESGRPWPRAAG